MSAAAVRVYLVEDHTIVRQGLVALLEQAPDLAVSGQAGDGRTALEEILADPPDVLLCDLALPGLSGLELIKRLKAEGAPCKIVVLSMYHDPVWVQRALDAGAIGYLLKGSGVSDVVTAVRAVARGEGFLSPGARRAEQSEALTAREREVLTLLASGHTSKEIGGILDISPRTAEHHRARIMSKLQIGDVAGLTRYAIRTGLVDQNLR
ncbi:response regulator transcription factor [Myxococcota bacterium]|nr:response regulator transcription factor [Myxococcota bacterium]MBU1430554.1 response regulator transcription factor [Myxococcota bacterium]MBU1897495.1 response regulator transcription factor [Myxococcota bacterium]